MLHLQLFQIYKTQICIPRIPEEIFIPDAERIAGTAKKYTRNCIGVTFHNYSYINTGCTKYLDTMAAKETRHCYSFCFAQSTIFVYNIDKGTFWTRFVKSKLGQ